MSTLTHSIKQAVHHGVVVVGDGWYYDFPRMIRSRMQDSIMWHEHLKWCGLSGTLFVQQPADKPWVQAHSDVQRVQKLRV